MTNMKQKKKMLLILAGAAVILLLLWILTGVISKKNTEKEETDADEEVTMVTDLADITRVEYNGDYSDFVFAKEDGSWVYEADTNAPINQSLVSSMVSGWASLAADRVFLQPDALADYGLEDPLYTISLTDADGVVTTLTIGDGAGEDYYAAVTGSTAVYTVSSTVVTYIGYSLDEFIATDTDFPAVSGNTLQQVDITEDGTLTTYTDETDLQAIAGGLCVFSASEFADYYAENDELEAYGLDEDNRITVTFTYTDDEKEASYTMYIGSLDADSSNYYVMLQNSNIVYTQSQEIVENILNYPD